MGQTLTHGVYLPDEGERNCYNGLAANWSILDNSVGTIAEHTSALAGKAPAVHTHTKSDITDFPAYGNAAGTICEGNDSRLSDARTPVAHTHTKSDVTDLLNSNFIPSANNSYDLGSSSYQWNNVYSKNYFYNGVAWGLDKGNTWTESNVWTKSLLLQNTDITDYKSNPSSDTDRWIQFWGNDWRYWGGIGHVYFTTGVSEVRIAMSNWSTNGSQGYWHLDFGVDKAFSQVYFRPNGDNICNLGDSTHRWKTLNGVNPGALSLPGTGGYTDIKGDITNLSGGDNTFTAPYDGWVCVRSANATVIHIINTYWAVSQSATRSTAGTLCCLCPVMFGQSFIVIVNATSLEYAYIHPCKGNV